MSGLVLKLAPGERVVVNGAVLENGDKPARVRIADSNVRVLRCRDALRPDEVDTPVKQIYFGVQLLITGDIDEDRALPAIDEECAKLEDVFLTLDPDLVPDLRALIHRGNYYSALCHLRQMLSIEAELLHHAAQRAMPPLQAQAV